MLDIQLIRSDPKKVKDAVSAKNGDPNIIDTLLEIDLKKRALIKEIEELREQRNIAAKEKDVTKGKTIKSKLQKLEPSLDKIEKEFLNIIQKVPNIPSSKTPIGIGEKDNVEVKKWGEITNFDFKPKDHLELGKSLGILDFETGAKVAGSQFYFLSGDGVLLELALVNYALEKLAKMGFVPVITPDLAKSRYYFGTGYAPKGDEAQTFVIEGEDLGLIATAEVTLAGKHADEIISGDKLPLKYVGYSHCFRQEAGAYGKYSKGLYRVHQFTKVEMFVYSKEEDSDKYLDEILKIEEEIYKDLKLPYRVVEMCTGDLGAMAARKFDLEVWMPGRNDYGEVTSTSNCTDYQARNLNIKYRKKDGTNAFVHMVNGTAIATSRTILAILENYQNKDGSITIPTVLQKWMGKEKI